MRRRPLRLFGRAHWFPQFCSFEMSPAKQTTRQMSDSFAKKEFAAAVYFIDMVNFTGQALGRAPKEVAELASPFLHAVVDAATSNMCFVDKTMGDEVMVVMPVFEATRDPFDEVMWFLADAVARIQQRAPGIAFRVGACFGNVFLDEVKAETFHEWSVYGNCVNGAKRLQSVHPVSVSEDPTRKYRLVVGAIEAEKPAFREEIRAWLRAPKIEPESHRERPLTYVVRHLECGELKGVGRMCFLDSWLVPRPDFKEWRATDARAWH